MSISEIEPHTRMMPWALLEGLSEACLIADANLRLAWSNEAARELLLIRGKTTGRKLTSVLADRECERLTNEALSTGKQRGAAMLLTLTGEGERLYDFSALPFQHEGAAWVRVALRRKYSPAQSAASMQEKISLNVLEGLGDPMTIITGYLENLLDNAIKDPVQVRRALAAMQRQAHSIQRVLTGLRK